MILAPLRRVVAGTGRETVCECRRCGTTVRSGTDRCPECDAADIARYDIR